MKQVKVTLNVVIYGLIFSFLGGYINGAFTFDNSTEIFIIIMSSSVIANPLGIIIGLILLNKFMHTPGSLIFGIAGSVLGGAVTLLLFTYAGNFVSSWLPLTVFVTYIPAMALAIFGYMKFYGFSFKKQASSKQTLKTKSR